MRNSVSHYQIVRVERSVHKVREGGWKQESARVSAGSEESLLL